MSDGFGNQSLLCCVGWSEGEVVLLVFDDGSLLCVSICDRLRPLRNATSGGSLKMACVLGDVSGICWCSLRIVCRFGSAGL